MRRYAPIKASRGTTWPLAVQVQIRHRDGVCVGPRIGMPGECFGPWRSTTSAPPAEWA